MAAQRQIQYVLFDMDGTFSRPTQNSPILTQHVAGLMIDSERVYTDVTSTAFNTDCRTMDEC